MHTLQITTIGKYGGSTTKSRIPIGSFYGHSYILPWECSSVPQPTAASAGEGQEDSTYSSIMASQPSVLQQLTVYISMQEDIQCRYSLAATRLQVS